MKIVLFLLWLLFIALPIGNRGLWSPDEPRYLQVAWEMAQAKSYVIPLLNEEPYSHKPPLFFWLTILAAQIFPFETASRWVSALASLGTLILTFLMGRRAADERTGFTASLIFMSCYLPALLMHSGNIDTLLTFLTTLSFYFFITWEGEQRRKWIVLAYGACGLGVLAKGPAALLIPWLTFFVWTIFKFPGRDKASFSHLIWGPLLSLAVVSLWLIPACIEGGAEYREMILFKQNIGRAISSFAHAEPWYFFLANFPALSLPWFIVLLGAIPDLKRAWKEKEGPLFFCILWFCVVLVFFSLISGKRSRYLLPAFPAFSIMLAHIVARWQDEGKGSRSLSLMGILILTFGALLLIFPMLLPLFQKKWPLLEIFPVSGHDWRLWAFYGGGVMLGVLLWRSFRYVAEKQNIRASWLFSSALLVSFGMGQVYCIPYLDKVKSARAATEKIREILPPDGSIAFYKKRYDNGWNFYLKRRARIPVVLSLDELKEAEPMFDVVIARNIHAGQLEELMKDNVYRVASIERIGHKRFLLLKRP
ncbi:MAG: glycosyltransferase family 39 protein [Deltaproteobacteria bacterium]|nr:glycosyltransferase family 39 protein [Deltaproteobacteria bacterium]